MDLNTLRNMVSISAMMKKDMWVTVSIGGKRFENARLARNRMNRFYPRR